MYHFVRKFLPETKIFADEDIFALRSISRAIVRLLHFAHENQERIVYDLRQQIKKKKVENHTKSIASKWMMTKNKEHEN